MILPVNATSGLLTDIRAGSVTTALTNVTWGDGTGYFFNFLGNSSRTSNVMSIRDNGSVGINCNAPAYKLDLNGDFQLSNNTGDYGYIKMKVNPFTTGGGSPLAHLSEIEIGSGYGPWIRGTKLGGGGYADAINLGFWTNVALNNAAPAERMTIAAATGYVGIGCNTPSFPLVVNGFLSSNLGQGTYFQYGIGITTHTTTIGHNTTIFAQTGVVAGAFIAYSDQRIKTDIQDVQDDEALQQLRLIQPKTYKYKDIIEKGSTPVYGFIAQQVRSVLPYSTGLIKNTIPDIYHLGDRVDDIVTLRDSTFSFNESSGNVKFIQKKGGDIIVPVNFISSNQLQILDTSNLDQTESEIFVYGREVNDFHSLNKDAIFTVNVAATQEIDRQLQAAKVQIASLETRLALLESQFAASQTPQ
jgi:hypothetical protein